MKTIIIILFSILSINCYADPALEFKVTPMVGMGIRFNPSKSEYDYNGTVNQRQDAFYFTGKAFLFESKYGDSSLLVGGIGYQYQLDKFSDLSISPFAIKGKEGMTLSIDLFRTNEKGGWLGIAVGWSF
jgi:hypothetical protein